MTVLLRDILFSTDGSASRCVVIPERDEELGVRLNVASLGTDARIIAARTLNLQLEDALPGVGVHSFRVAEISRAIGIQLGFSTEEVVELFLGGLYHDLGKLTNIELYSDGNWTLTPEQRKVVIKHPTEGARILEGVESPEVLLLIERHHEKFDGSGYADSLCGREMPLIQQVIPVADAFSAMTDRRKYDIRRYSTRKAVQEICSGSGRAYNPRVVCAFVRVMCRESPVTQP